MIKAYRRTSFRYDFIRENHEKEINFSFKFVSQEGKDKKKPHFKGLNLHFEFFNIFNSVILRFTDKYAEEGKYGGIVATHWMIGILNVLRRFLLVFFAFYLGVDKMQGLIDAIPTVLIDGMDAAAGLLPALGFAMLMRMILNKQIIPYFFLGFICAAYLGMPVLGVAILGLIIVVVQFGFLNPKNETATASINEEVDDDDF